eukprot:gene44595-55493_t
MRVIAINGSRYTVQDLTQDRVQHVHVSKLRPFLFDANHTDPREVANAEKQVFDVENILDIGYNHYDSPIPTPFIDSLAEKGIQMKNYYTHSLCTPARASIMTGRYHVNTGLTYILAIGTPAGLSPTIPTMPSVLKHEGHYST